MILIRSKIVIDNGILESVNHFKCLGNIVAYTNEFHVSYRLNSLIKITGVKNDIFKKKLIKSRLVVYNILALPTLLYGSGCWKIKAKPRSSTVATEIKFTGGKVWVIFQYITCRALPIKMYLGIFLTPEILSS